MPRSHHAMRASFNHLRTFTGAKWGGRGRTVLAAADTRMAAHGVLHPTQGAVHPLLLWAEPHAALSLRAVLPPEHISAAGSP